jgi:enoyl-CoA hydratase
VLLKSAVPGIFMAGADLGMMNGSWESMLHTIRAFHQAGNAWERIPCPTIAVIGGHAAGGGCELALACDFRLMATGRPTIGLPEVKLGLLASGGGTQRLARLAGRATALDLLLRGRMLEAEEARAAGLVHDAHPPDALDERAGELARELAALPPLAVAEIKRCVLEGLDVNFAAGLALEERGNLFLSTTDDAREGVRAFVERRPPKFRFT